MPWYQWLGSGCGNVGSTSKRGTMILLLLACASAFFSRMPWPMPSASSSAASVEPIKKFLFMSVSPLLLHEFLDPLAVEGLAGVDVALRVDRDAADAVESARIPPTVAA